MIHGVRALKSLFALLLLGTWFPCTVHCALELASPDRPLPSGAVATVANQSPSAPADTDHCICGCMKSGGYAFQKSAPSPVPPVAVLVLFTLPVAAGDSLTTPPLPQVILSPPELSSRWQFIHRTAASPRGPSLIS